MGPLGDSFKPSNGENLNSGILTVAAAQLRISIIFCVRCFSGEPKESENCEGLQKIAKNSVGNVPEKKLRKFSFVASY